jgi:hypothetical protein
VYGEEEAVCKAASNSPAYLWLPLLMLLLLLEHREK